MLATPAPGWPHPWPGRPWWNSRPSGAALDWACRVAFGGGGGPARQRPQRQGVYSSRRPESWYICQGTMWEPVPHRSRSLLTPTPVFSRAEALLTARRPVWSTVGNMEDGGPSGKACSVFACLSSNTAGKGENIREEPKWQSEGSQRANRKWNNQKLENRRAGEAVNWQMVGWGAGGQSRIYKMLWARDGRRLQALWGCVWPGSRQGGGREVAANGPELAECHPHSLHA